MLSHKKNSGFTLIELILVLGLMSFLTVLAASSQQMELEQTKAKQIGNVIFQYNNAARSWLSSNVGATDSTKIGTAWLKSTSCGGLSSISYLPCSFPEATPSDPIDFGGIAFTTEIKSTGSVPNKITTIKTTTSPMTLAGGTVRADLAGLAAIVASAGASISDTPSHMATDGSFKSNPFTGVITMMASNNANDDAWLRTDGSNTMNANLKFNSTNAATLREIHNASRIMSIAGQALSIGNPGGAAAGYSVVVDADMSVYGNLSAGKSITAGLDIFANRNMKAQRFYDMDNNLFYVDPAGVSKVNSIDASSNITSDTMISAPVFYDKDNTSYKLDMTGSSILSTLNTKSSLTSEGVSRFVGKSTFDSEIISNKVVSMGSFCTPNGAIARDISGMTLSCQSGIWSSSGNVKGQYLFRGYFTGGANLATGANAAMIQVTGGSAASCGGDGENRFSLRGYVNGAYVAGSVNNNSSFAKIGSITFGVPANTTYSIISDPYNCPAGVFMVYEFQL